MRQRTRGERSGDSARWPSRSRPRDSTSAALGWSCGFWSGDEASAHVTAKASVWSLRSGGLRTLMFLSARVEQGGYEMEPNDPTRARVRPGSGGAARTGDCESLNGRPRPVADGPAHAPMQLPGRDPTCGFRRPRILFWAPDPDNHSQVRLRHRRGQEARRVTGLDKA